MPFDKKKHRGSEEWQLLCKLTEVYGVVEFGYTNNEGRGSSKKAVPLYLWSEYNLSTEEVVEHAEFYIHEQVFADGKSVSRNGNTFSDKVSWTHNLASMLDTEDNGGWLDLDKILGKRLYPQRDRMAGWSVRSVDDILARDEDGQKEIDKLVASGDWGYKPKVLAKPMRRRGVAEIQKRS